MLDLVSNFKKKFFLTSVLFKLASILNYSSLVLFISFNTPTMFSEWYCLLSWTWSPDGLGVLNISLVGTFFPQFWTEPYWQSSVSKPAYHPSKLFQLQLVTLSDHFQLIKFTPLFYN